MLFEIDETAVGIIDSSGQLYIITGRIPFDDDDTTMIFQAQDEDEAAEAFKQAMYDNDPPEDDPRGDPAVYITNRIQLGSRT